MSEIGIRPLETIADFRAAEELQGQVWASTHERETVPLHMLTTVAHSGGVALGAWDAEAERLVGFVFGFLGTDDTEPDRPALARLKHCSHMLGVLPEYRDRGIGYRLKLAQMEAVHRQGIRLITWTFDPLESRNANLNIARLGAVCRTYKREVYGQMADGLNVGWPSDRFQLDSRITAHRVKQRLGGERPRLSLDAYLSANAPILNPTRLSPQGLPHMTAPAATPDGAICLVEIPADIQTVKAQDFELAREWRMQVRWIFESAFEAGYIATDFLLEKREGRMQAYYVLAHGEVRLGGQG